MQGSEAGLGGAGKHESQRGTWHGLGGILAGYLGLCLLVFFNIFFWRGYGDGGGVEEGPSFVISSSSLFSMACVMGVCGANENDGMDR